MRIRLYLLLGVMGVGAACGSSDDNFGAAGGGGTSTGGSGGEAGDAAGAGGDDGGGNGGTGTGGSAGASTGGSNGGNAGAGASGGGTAGSSGSAGSAGAPTCPGAAPGCVIDWAGQFGSSAAASQDGVGQAAVFGGNDGLRGITGDGAYVYSAGHNCIRRIAIVDATVETIAGQCGTPGYQDARGSAARFENVDGLATDGTTLWIVDGGNFLIRALDLSSNDVTTLTGLQATPGLVDGDSATAEFDSMLGMTYDGTHIYITEGGTNQSVRRIDPTTGDVDTVAGGNGTGAMNGAGDVAQLSAPRKLSTDGTDLFIGDTENHQVRRIVLGSGGADTHTVSVLAGAAAGYADATGTAAAFRRLRGITFDGTDLIVADSDNCTLRKVVRATGAVTTIAGIQISPCANHAEGVGTQAEFNKPMDIHFDAGTGDLFVTEGNVLRRMYYR